MPYIGNITQDFNVNNAMLDTDSVTSIKIVDGTIEGADIAANLDLSDSQKIRFGAGNDLQIYHDGNHSRIDDTGTGALIASASKFQINNAASNEVQAFFLENGASALYYDNSKKFETMSTGVDVHGTLRADEIKLQGDNQILKIGGADDLQLYHSGQNSIINNNVGDLRLESDVIELLNHDSNEFYLRASNGGAVELYYDNSKKFETLTGGCQIANIANNAGLLLSGTGNNTSVMFTSTADSPDNGYRVSYHSVGTSYFGDEFLAIDKTDTTGSGGIETITAFTPTGQHFADNKKIHIGGTAATGDLQIYHDGSNSHVTSGTGQFFLSSSNSNIWLRGTETGLLNTDGSEYMIRATSNGSVKLFYDNSQKFETTSVGISVTGTHTATNYGSINLSASTSEVRWPQDASASNSRNFNIIGEQGQYGVLDVKYANARDENPNEKSTRFIANGSVELYYDNSRKFLTTSTGCGVNGDLTFADNSKAKFGAGDDLQIYSNGVAGYIDHVTTGTGADLILRSKTFVVRNLSDETMIVGNQNGAVNLYYDNTLMFATSADGAAVSNISNNRGLDLNGVGNNTGIRFMSTGSSPGHAYRINYHSVTNNIFDSPCISFDKTDTSGNFDSHICGISDEGFHLADNKKLHLGSTGASGDLQIYHDGTDSYIDSNTGKLYVLTNNFIDIRGTNNETMIKATPNDSVQLYYDNSKKFETTSTGIEVSGHSSHFNAGANALVAQFNSAYGGAGATTVVRLKMNTSALHGLQLQLAGSGTSVAGGNHAATIFNTENAKLRLGTNNAEQFRIEDNGDLKANDTSIGSLSDSSLKKNIVVFTYDLSKFKQFKPKKFDWINPELHGNKSDVRGFVAQEIETVDSTLVGNYELYDETLTDKNPDLAIIEADDGTNIAKDSKLGTNDAMYISVIQQMLTKIETLETKVAVLEAA